MERTEDNKEAVFGIYDNRPAVERGVMRLKDDGFMSSDISVLLPDAGGSANFAHENSTKVPEGATTGAGAGLALGGGLGWLVGVGMIAIPGIGPLIAAGPIVAMLAGAGAGAALGGVAGGLIGMGIPEYEAKRYEGFVKGGGILLSVHVATDDLKARAKKALEESGARDISASGEVAAPKRTSDARPTVYPNV